MVPRSVPKAILEAGRFQEPARGGCVKLPVAAFWRHLADFARSKLPAANSRSGSMKKGFAIGEFEKIIEKY